ncbi:MAG: redoxin domain-containing protein [candidate division Zixibacteria bacterium]|nr:redoxin domain-containing protein [candidate division Zixibacteria bacterium]MDH3937128.1 redoxin domain-containing protein [candidate division Zixibacteria bacterium]
MSDSGRSEAEGQVQLAIGDPAPDFTLATHNEGELNLAWYQGRKNVVLAFYPADWTPVCSTQVPEYQKKIERFEELDCQLFCLSCDSVPCHIAWAKSMSGLDFPLMADFWPHGEVARKYGVLNRKGYAERTVFLIDKKGIIRWIERLHPADLPNNDDLFEQLAKLNA